MSRFLERQLSSAESKPLGRAEFYCDYDDGKFTSGVRRMDAAKNPPNTMNFAVPVGRTRGVAIPGSEAVGGRGKK